MTFLSLGYTEPKRTYDMQELIIHLENRYNHFIEVIYPESVAELLLKCLHQLVELKKADSHKMIGLRYSEFEILIEKFENSITKGEELLFNSYEWGLMSDCQDLWRRKKPFKSYGVFQKLDLSLQEWDLLDQSYLYVFWDEKGLINWLPNRFQKIEIDRFPQTWLEKRQRYFELFGKNGFVNTTEGWSSYAASSLKDQGVYQYREDFYWESTIYRVDSFRISFGFMLDPEKDIFHPLHTNCIVGCCGEYLGAYPVSQAGIDSMYEDMINANQKPLLVAK